ncbi:MAG: hypothetical protein HY554_03395 [Elusimicrobia bacterium]|nr:hypothetical protein [Elusimicrobiota bacterium]
MSLTSTSGKTSGAVERPALYPPRAADTRWWLRVLAAVGRWAAVPTDLSIRLLDRLWDQAARLLSRAPAPSPQSGTRRPEAPEDRVLILDPEVALVLSTLPGLGHCFAQGPSLRAALLASAYPLLAVWALLFPPLKLEHVAFMALFGFHQWVMVDSHRRSLLALGLPAPTGRSAVRPALIAVTVLSAFYGAAVAVAGLYGRPVRLTSDALAPVVEAGDRLWVRSQPSYRRGDIVYSRVHGGLERVVALEGEEVWIEAGVLRVNGRPLPAEDLPISEAIYRHDRLQGARLTVPAGSYCVFFPARHEYLSKNRLLANFIVPRHQIAGRLTRRYFPNPRAF